MLVNFLIGTFSNFDVFAPWSQITSMKVATPDHSLGADGLDYFTRWQDKMDGEDEEGPA